MIQKEFADKVVSKIKDDPGVVGLAAGGSFIYNEMDEFSDLDLILVTKEKISGEQEKMFKYARQFGQLLNAFSGEHVGEPRLLICLYENPLLHVDIKFLTPDELLIRIENPVVLFERNNVLTTAINSSQPKWPMPDYQWIEDRFWTWVHYVTSKIGRGEYFDCLDALAFLRARVISPLLQVKNKLLPRGVRRLEFDLGQEDLMKMKNTVGAYDRYTLVTTLENMIDLYRSLRKDLFPTGIRIQERTEKASLTYLSDIKRHVPGS